MVWYIERPYKDTCRPISVWFGKKMEQNKENVQPEEEEVKEKCQNVCIFKITFTLLLYMYTYVAYCMYCLYNKYVHVCMYVQYIVLYMFALVLCVWGRE